MFVNWIGMTCDLDNGGSTHVYPRTTDPVYCGAKVLSTPIVLTQFTVNVGTSTVATLLSKWWSRTTCSYRTKIK